MKIEMLVDDLEQEFIDLISYNRSYYQDDSFNASLIKLDDIYAKTICKYFADGHSDNEVAISFSLDIRLISAIRSKIIFKEISDQYDYPIVYTKEICMNRAVELAKYLVPPLGLCYYLGIDESIASRIFAENVTQEDIDIYYSLDN